MRLTEIEKWNGKNVVAQRGDYRIAVDTGWIGDWAVRKIA